MRMRLERLVVRAKRSVEEVSFSPTVSFFHGPVSTGKSTIARLVDYCLGGSLERTPAIQSEFVSADLYLTIGTNSCRIERSADDQRGVRVSWESEDSETHSVFAPFDPSDQPIVAGRVMRNFSDLMFFLAGVVPIKVRKRARDPDSPMIRLSFRDVWFYCYLDQLHLDSSFFRLEDPFRGRKSQDAMRFFTGLHSERLSQLESAYIATLDKQRGNRAAVAQIRAFMDKFGLASQFELTGRIEGVRTELQEVTARLRELDRSRASEIHPTDTSRIRLRKLGEEIDDLSRSIQDAEVLAEQQVALKGELITAKVKANRIDAASRIFEGVKFKSCPQCGEDVSERVVVPPMCSLCCSVPGEGELVEDESVESEVFRRDLNDRIDELSDAIRRREAVIQRSRRQLSELRREKGKLDAELQAELARYDSSFVEAVRALEATRAALTERMSSLQQLEAMPQAIAELDAEVGQLQGNLEGLRASVESERARLRAADKNVSAIAAEFKRIMLSVGLPGVEEGDEVVLDPRNWSPTVVHGEQAWGFWDAGSGGKKTLFNVCYALAVHAVAIRLGMPVPSILIVDSPTKNISDDENPELVSSLYREIFSLSAAYSDGGLQVILVDSDLVTPPESLKHFVERRLAGTSEAPSLIGYYSGP